MVSSCDDSFIGLVLVYLFDYSVFFLLFGLRLCSWGWDVGGDGTGCCGGGKTRGDVRTDHEKRMGGEGKEG